MWPFLAAQGWGLDSCLFLLLLAAFLAINALSLAYLAFIAAGMACGTAARQVGRASIACLVGVPPAHRTQVSPATAGRDTL